MECKSKKTLLLILLTAFVLFTFTSNVSATVNTPSFPTINVNQLTPTTIQRFNTEFEQNNLSYKMFIGSDGKIYLNVWVDGSGARDVYEWNSTTNKWVFSTTLSSNTLVKGAEEPRTPATSRYTTWDEYVRSIGENKTGEGSQTPDNPLGSSGYAGLIVPILLAGAAAAAGGYVGSGVVFEPAPLPRCDTVTCTAVTGCTGYSGGGICPSVDCSSVFCLTYTGGCPSNCGGYCSCNTAPCSCNTAPCSCNTKPTCSCDTAPCSCNTKPTCSSDCSCNTAPCSCVSGYAPCTCDTAPCSCVSGYAPCTCDTAPCSCVSGYCSCNTAPCSCVSGYCSCNTKPCSCVSGYCSCNTKPCPCNTAPCSCNTKCSCNTNPCPCNTAPCSCNTKPCPEYCNPVYPGGCSKDSCPTYDPCSTNTCNGDCARYNPCPKDCSRNCSCVSGYCSCNTKPCSCVSGYAPCTCNTKPCGCVKQTKCNPVAN